jgi:hypothetical protein
MRSRHGSGTAQKKTSAHRKNCVLSRRHSVHVIGCSKSGYRATAATTETAIDSVRAKNLRIGATTRSSAIAQKARSALTATPTPKAPTAITGSSRSAARKPSRPGLSIRGRFKARSLSLKDLAPKTLSRPTASPTAQIIRTAARKTAGSK